MSMKAVLCKQYGPPEHLVVEEIPSPRAGPGEVVVSVRAAGVNFPDVLIVQNKYQFKAPLPFSPGSELSGIVKALGARVIACASSEEKLAICRQHGADATIDYVHEDLRDKIKTLTQGRGADVVYDPVGGAYSEPAFRSLAWRGRFLVVGFA